MMGDLLTSGSKQSDSLGSIAPQQQDLATLLRIAATGVDKPGLTGIDPKFVQDPRFDYQTILEPSGLVLMGNAARDDSDSAPIGAHSTLAVDTPWERIAADMEGKEEGPSPWFTENAKDIMGNSKKATKAMAEEMRRRMLQTRDRIEDRY